VALFFDSRCIMQPAGVKCHTAIALTIEIPRTRSRVDTIHYDLYIICTKSVCGQRAAAAVPRAHAAHSYRHEVIGRVDSRAPDSDRTGLTDPPEDWPAALPP